MTSLALQVPSLSATCSPFHPTSQIPWGPFTAGSRARCRWVGLPPHAADQVESPCYGYLKYHNSPSVAFNTVTISYWCCDLKKLISVTLLTCSLYMDKGPHLLLLSVVSSMFIPCLILSSRSVKMSWMNKCDAVPMTCHLVADHV